MDRRYFLRGVAGTTVAAGGFLAGQSTVGASPATAASMRGVFDVIDYGAKGDGTVNDAPSIQKAIEAAESQGGGIVWLPPGLYLIGSGLVIIKQVILAGAGWGLPFTAAPHSKEGDFSNGSHLYVTGTDFIPLTVAGMGTTIRDLAFYHKQPEPAPGWAPAPYPSAIFVHAADVRLENILLFNPTVGINIQDVGRVTVSRVFGQPLQTGIRFDYCQDVNKIENIHFWPYWSYDPPVTQYTTQHGQVFASYRNDNPDFSNIFAYGYSVGFLFGQGEHGITSRFHISNADLDSVGTGVKIDSAGTTGQITNLTYMGCHDDLPGIKPAQIGIDVSAADCLLQAVNVRLDLPGTHAIRVAGKDTEVSVENLIVETWDTNQTGAPAVSVEAGATLSLGFNRSFRRRINAIIPPSTSPLSGGSGKLRLAGETKEKM